MKEAYGTPAQFRPKSLELIQVCDRIIREYIKQDYRLTIRQLYYQLVARDYIENTVRSYDNTVTLLTNARIAGLIDWDAIEDRTRDFIERAHWGSGSEILQAVGHQYHQDMWAQQLYRVFVIVEKEALAGVLERVCREWDVPLLAARGYPSVTVLREFAKQRLVNCRQEIVILHLGDHDPSGIDMTRDLRDRLRLFSYNKPFELRRIALNMDQVEEEQPPPNPAKVTDSRYDSYLREYGAESWELDALTPQYLHSLVAREIETLVDLEQWNFTLSEIDAVKERIVKIADDFDN